MAAPIPTGEAPRVPPAPTRAQGARAWPPTAPSETPASAATAAARSVALAVDALRPGPCARAVAIDDAHVCSLAEVLDATPPILVRAATLEVVDGAHRVAAARALGRATIRATLEEFDEDAAYEAHVRANARHGLALTLTERRGAALELLRRDPQRSDRDLARTCALSPTTVGAVRREAVQRGELPTQPATRRGRDGKTYPAPDLDAPPAPAAAGRRWGPLTRALAWLRRLWTRVTASRPLGR